MISALIKSMAAAGAPLDAIVLAVEAIEAGQAKDAERRAKQAERTARCRAMKRERSVTVTEQSRNPSPSPSPPPRPPTTPPPAPVVITPLPSEAAPRGADRSRGTRVASNWTLDAEGRAYAADLGMAGPEIDREAVNFHDFWLAKAGAAGRKVDWPATWRTWARRAAESRGRMSGGRSARPPPSNARLDVAGELLDYLHERDYPG